MAFTQDEIQTLNSILDAKLLLLRREMQRAFDQRIAGLKREFEQHLVALQQDLRALPRRVADQQSTLGDPPGYQSNPQQQQFAERMVETFDARLLAIEQLLKQQLMARLSNPAASNSEAAPTFEAIELQTEISWEDLAAAVDRAVGTRLAALDESVQSMLRQMERYLSPRLHGLPDSPASGVVHPNSEHLSTMQDAFASIEYLERVIESMQVAMSTNHALLSNRLYHHQQLPLERAHPHSDNHTPPVNGSGNQLPRTDELEGEQR
ncbi:MAG TPA: hypothetical protein VKV37_14890 [Ktedonobacteraceae bacterium]|nr:hypothetical protein [Ktedonobacteraceae bacterium]